MSIAKAIWPGLLAVAVTVGQHAASAQEAAEFEAVNATHEAYHAAFGKEDIELLSDIWLLDSSARLIVPPSDKVLTGWEEVRGSFEQAFEVLDVISLTSKDALTVVGDEMAWTVDVHEFEMRTGDGQVIKPNFFSTHVYQKVDGAWLMVVHQASAPPAPSNQ